MAGLAAGALWGMVFVVPRMTPGLVLTTVGLALMMTAMQPAQAVMQAGESHFGWGVLLAAAAMVCWTAFALLNAAWLLWSIAGSTSNELLALDGIALVAIICVVTGIGSGWAANILWNLASQRLSVSLCGQLIVSETLFALLYSFFWDGALPSALQWVAAVLFTLGILASIRAHQ